LHPAIASFPSRITASTAHSLSALLPTFRLSVSPPLGLTLLLLFLVHITVLRDDSRDTLGMPHSQTVADGSAVVENVHGELRQPDSLGELIDDSGQVVEAVLERLATGALRLSERREVGGDEVEIAAPSVRASVHETCGWQRGSRAATG